MRDPRSIALHLAQWARDELAGQERALELLAEQERCIRERDFDGMTAAHEALESYERASRARGRRRAELHRQLERVWGVPAGVLTLGSIVERLGPDGECLAELREQLRDRAAQVLHASRRLGVVAASFRRISAEVVETLLTDEDGNPLHEGGSLVNARV